MKKTSLADIAKSLKVSKTLVSMVLNNRGDENGISESTQQKVIAKAKALNYQPNQIARGLRLGKSNTIGLIVADISNAFYAKIARSVENYAEIHGYNVMFCSSDESPEKEAKLIQMMKDRQVDGLIIATTQQNSTSFIQLKNENYPFVLVDRYLPRVNSNYVIVDNYNGALTMLNHLLQLGYRKIAQLTISPSHLSSVKDRTLAYKDALKNHGVRFNKKFVREIPHKNINQNVKKEIIDLLTPPNSINAIFAANNNIAIACLEAIKELNLRIPHDLALVSFDDVELFRFCEPPITAVSQNVDEIGKHAVNILVENIDDKENFMLKNIVLPTELIIRRSCGAYLKKL